MQCKADFPDISDKGVYCLIFKCKGCNLDAGRIKDIEFRPGYYIYVGSALGSGGLKRLKRHVLLSLTNDKIPRWHVDYLSVSSAFRLICVVYAFSEDSMECMIAKKLYESFGIYIKYFGSGDCKCHSHLYYGNSNPLKKVEIAFSEMDIEHNSVCFKDL